MPSLTDLDQYREENTWLVLALQIYTTALMTRPVLDCLPAPALQLGLIQNLPQSLPKPLIFCCYVTVNMLWVLGERQWRGLLCVSRKRPHVMDCIDVTVHERPHQWVRGTREKVLYFGNVPLWFRNLGKEHSGPYRMSLHVWPLTLLFLHGLWVLPIQLSQRERSVFT